MQLRNKMNMMLVLLEPWCHICRREALVKLLKNRKSSISCIKSSLLQHINIKWQREEMKVTNKKYKALIVCSNRLWLNLYLCIKSRSQPRYTENLLLKSNQLLKHWTILTSTWGKFQTPTCIHSFYNISNLQQRSQRPQQKGIIVMMNMREYRLHLNIKWTKS